MHLPEVRVWMQAVIDVNCTQLEARLERDQCVQEHTGIQAAAECYDEAIRSVLGHRRTQGLEDP